MGRLSNEEISKMKNEAQEETKETLDKLENDYPGISEGVATALGAAAGGAGSLATLGTLGVAGFSAAGITSGLATAGAIVGGGMLAGIGVLAAPIALLAVAGYAITKKKKNAKLAVVLGTAIQKLYAVQDRLMQNAEYFKDEIAGIRATIDLLTKKKPS